MLLWYIQQIFRKQHDSFHAASVWKHIAAHLHELPVLHVQEDNSKKPEIFKIPGILIN